MTLRRLGTAVAVLLAVFMAAPAYAAPYDYGSANKGAVVSTTRPGAGHWFVFGGSGFQPGSRVFVVPSRGGFTCYPKCSATANSAGRFYVLVKLARSGRTSLTAVGVNRDGYSRAVGVRVTVRGPRPQPGTQPSPYPTSAAAPMRNMASTSSDTSGMLVPAALGASLLVPPVALGLARRRRRMKTNA